MIILSAKLQKYYQRHILLQFAVHSRGICWGETRRLANGDECGFWFTADGKPYVLIWTDYQDGGMRADAVQYLLGLEPGQYTFVEPAISTYAPSFRTPDWTHEEGFVGWFTLLALNRK